MPAAGHASPWIRRFHPVSHPDDTGRVHLVCFPHAGGPATSYTPLSANLSALAPFVDVVALQYPGRQDRLAEPPVADLTELSRLIAGELRPLAAEGRPLVFFGHSMGAELAFETARLLERTGAAPAALLLSGRRPPSRRRSQSIHLRDDDDLLEHVLSLSGTDPQLFADEEFRALLLPALRADYTAIETHTPDPAARVGCPITVFTGDRDPQLPVADAHAWAAHTTGRCDVRVFPGGHFYLSDHPRDVAAAVSETVAVVAS
ncbi:thioesterase II family protein [Marinactinospora rubrisoli]|uniref:Thioesterase II family protein n=1 Tax=Marinactinospora rubrisoli TaxID=2715399 RepID=A0ABW2KNJ2_9ACTN